MKTHTLWSLGFLVTFTLGGISGMFFPVAGLDVHFHDSYFVVAHFHYVFIGGTVFGYYPVSITGTLRLPDENSMKSLDYGTS